MGRNELLAFLAALTRKRAGFTIDTRDARLVEMRLAPLARREGYSSAWALLRTAADKPAGPLAFGAVEAMAPRRTWFFRDRAAFAALETAVLPALLDGLKGARPAQIWCAGCGAGQEAYSLAMLAEERRARGQAHEAEILATDFSPQAAKRAEAGLYDQYEVQRGLAIRRLVEHFDKQGDRWQPHAALRRRVTARAASLLDGSGGAGEAGPFDLVLLRHVLPEFTPRARMAALSAVAAHLRPGGWLMLGAGEALPEDEERFEPAPEGPGLYRIRPGEADLRAEAA